MFVVGQDTMELSVKNNELQFNINELEKTISEKDSIISSKSSDYVKETVNEKKVIPKWVWYALLLIPLFILFPVIPKVINKFFRGLIKI